MDKIKQAMESVKKGQLIADKCPHRPEFHFLAPAYWMNDPNGPIFYKGEYHMFYQLNPYSEQHGNIYWGHAKSKDLVHWEHLPIALAPNEDEYGCWSGCCVNNDGIPTIFYTSIGPNKLPESGAEQWLATSHDDMITWEKHLKNPIMTLELHKSLDVRDWRDPYVWKEADTWYMVLGGHVREKREGKARRGAPGIVLLYQSQDLMDWQFLSPLCIGERRLYGRNWECPNFFPLGNKHVLIVSPHKEVIYNIGTYKDHHFTPGEWNVLDHGRCFYAPNTMFDENGRLILWGWIREGGTGGWNGCHSLPRILSLRSDGTLRIEPASELKMLRESNVHLENLIISPDSKEKLGYFSDLRLEMIAEFQLIDAESFGFKLFQSPDKQIEEQIEINSSNYIIRAGKEKGNLSSLIGQERLYFHIFIDKSVIEIFINNRECLTSRIYPETENCNGFDIYAINGEVRLKSLDLWTIESIW
jgi:beta-fructofuranosidase